MKDELAEQGGTEEAGRGFELQASGAWMGFSPDELGRLHADQDEEMPRLAITRKRAVVFAVFVLSAVGFLYFALPKFAGLSKTWDQLGRGDPVWLVVALGFELLSFVGYVVLFRVVFVRGDSRVGWRESYQITMSGLAATRLFASAGAGGIVLTAWALRRSGMERRIVACRMLAFLVLLYSVYMAALIVDGIGLRTGVLPGGGSFALTGVPAIFGAVVVIVFLAFTLLPADIERRLEGWARRAGGVGRNIARLVTAPATAASGVRTAIAIVRDGDWAAPAGAFAWWGFDICVLWSTFHAFGGPVPPFSVLVMAYFVGMLANVLPLPGGIGGVDGGMIGTLIAFHVDSGIAIVAVLTYRGFSFWLPTIPGAIAYLQLRRTVSRWKTEPQPVTQHAAAIL